MGNSRASCGTTIAVCVCLLVLNVAATQLAVGYLRSSRAATVLGGALSSFCSVWMLTLVSSVEEVISPSGSQQGWAEVALSVVTAAAVGFSVHPVSSTVSFFLSVFWMFYVYRVISDALQAPVRPTTTSNKSAGATRKSRGGKR